MTTISYKFREIPSYKTSRKSCCECGKSFTKTFKSSQTINPWNNKTSSEIFKENDVLNDKKADEWLSINDKCSKCEKLSIPNVTVNMITEDDWKEVTDLLEDYVQAQEFVNRCQKHIRQVFEGKAINIDDRIGIIDSADFWDFPKKLQIGYNLVRKDKKGVLEASEYKNFPIGVNNDL